MGVIRKKSNGKWGIVGKDGKMWDATYKTKKDALAGLRGYYASKKEALTDRLGQLRGYASEKAAREVAHLILMLDEIVLVRGIENQQDKINEIFQAYDEIFSSGLYKEFLAYVKETAGNYKYLWYNRNDTLIVENGNPKSKLVLSRDPITWTYSIEGQDFKFSLGASDFGDTVGRLYSTVTNSVRDISVETVISDLIGTETAIEDTYVLVEHFLDSILNKKA